MTRASVGECVHESLDGIGSADHDATYTFGRLPSAQAPFPFSTREFVRLLLLRSRVQDERFEPRRVG